MREAAEDCCSESTAWSTSEAAENSKDSTASSKTAVAESLLSESSMAAAEIPRKPEAEM